MFNVFSHDKKLAQTQEFERLKEKYVQEELHRRKTQEKLSLNYKKRVENFVVQMAEKPIVTHDFVPPVVKIRDEDPSKFLGPSSIIIRSFKHEKDRIKENIENYKNSRMEYTGTPFEFRKREVTKEIQPMMRFTSKSNFERVANRLKVLMQDPTQDPRLLAKGTESLSDSFILELSKSPQATNKYLAKNLLPDLNTKTHFKATYSLYLGIPDSLMDKRTAKNTLEKIKSEKMLKKRREEGSASPAARTSSKLRASTDIDASEVQNFAKTGSNVLPPLKQPTMGLKFEEGEEKHPKEQVHIETVNPIDVSKKVLEKCNVIRPKKEGVKTLSKGEGHLTSMSERSIKQIYDSVIHRSFAGKEI